MLLVFKNIYNSREEEQKVDFCSRIYKRLLDEYPGIQAITVDDIGYCHGICDKKSGNPFDCDVLSALKKVEYEVAVVEKGSIQEEILKNVMSFDIDCDLYSNILDLFVPKATFIGSSRTVEFFKNHKYIKCITYKEGILSRKYKHIGDVDIFDLRDMKELKNFTFEQLDELIDDIDVFDVALELYRERCYDFQEYYSFLENATLEHHEELLTDTELHYVKTHLYAYTYNYFFVEYSDYLTEGRFVDIRPESKTRVELRPHDCISLDHPKFSYIPFRTRLLDEGHIEKIIEYKDHPVAGPVFEKFLNDTKFRVNTDMPVIADGYHVDVTNYECDIDFHINCGYEVLSLLIPYLDEDELFNANLNKAFKMETIVKYKDGSQDTKTFYEIIRQDIEDNEHCRDEAQGVIYSDFAENTEYFEENVENAQEILNKMKNVMFKPTTCAICDEDHVIWNWSCGNCDTFICDSCGGNWYSSDLGRKFPVAKLLCPFCKKSPLFGLDFQVAPYHGNIWIYNKRSFKIVPKEGHVYAMCETCGKVEDTGEMNECNNEQEIENFTCKMCNDRPEYMECPCCSTPTILTDGCNHIKCPNCDEHWCYRCGEGGFDHVSVYTHMTEEHGGYYN